ncbi:MAG: YggT family protein [Promicromonosporaceae bacterium]|nr:YggT family protein [Promicromonosporaceae bacterium]
MRTAAHLAGLLLWLFLLALALRLTITWILAFARQWRPSGAALVVSESVFTVTDPPVRLASRLVPPLRLGGLSLNLGFILLFVGVGLLSGWLSGL